MIHTFKRLLETFHHIFILHTDIAAHLSASNPSNQHLLLSVGLRCGDEGHKRTSKPTVELKKASTVMFCVFSVLF